MVDGGWSGAQTFVFDAVSINGTVNGFGPSLASKEDCKNGGCQLHGFENQGACVRSPMASR